MRAARAARAVTCIALASALCVPALAGQTDYYLKIDGVEGESSGSKHKGEIEILSWSWGETTDGLIGTAPGSDAKAATEEAARMGSHAGGGGGGAGKVNMAAEPQAGKQLKQEALTIKQSGAAADPADEAARANDRLRNAGPVNSWPSEASSDGEAEITLKGAAAEEKKRPGRVKYGDITLKRGAAESAGGVSVAAGDVDGDGRAEAAHKSGSLVYLNRNRQKELLSPAAAGSLNLVVAPGHGLCTPGRTLGRLTLAGPGKRFVLSGVTVAGCMAASGGDRPAESLSLNYTKVEY